MSNDPLNNHNNSQDENFGLPNDYFIQSASNIANKIVWLQEHDAYTQLLKHKSVKGFIVPENYFTTNGNNLELIDYPKLKQFRGKNDFLLPNNYFENNSKKLYTQLASYLVKDVEDFSILNSLPKENGFTTSENYFKENSQKLYEVLKSKQNAKLIFLFKNKLSLAVAASLLLAIGVWLFNFYFKTVDVKDCGSIACIDQNEILNSNQIDAMNDEELFEIVNTEKLEQRIKNSKTQTDDSLDSTKLSDDFDELLDEL